MSSNNKLPDSWSQSTVDNIYDVVGGGTPSTNNLKYWCGKIPWITSADIHSLKEIVPRKTITKEAIENSTTNLVRKNSLIVVTRVGLGKIGLADRDLCFSQDCQGLVDKTGLIDPLFALYYLSTAVQEFKHKNRGTTISGVTKKQLKELPLFIPPLNEQKRIVAKIEQLFSDLDAGVETLKAIKKQVRQYRQSVLKYAFEGKLTKSGSNQNWEEVKLGDVAEMCLGKMLDKNKNKGCYEPYLRNINVRWGHFDLDDLLEMKFEQNEQERYGLISGDLIICEGGEPGRAAIWNNEAPNMKIQKALHRIRLNRNVNNKYLLYFLILSAQNGYLEEYFTGTTIKHLTGRRLKQFIFTIPDIEEQEHIVSEIERHYSIADKIEEVVNTAMKQSNQLRQSILKKAFEGRLVPQDPNDEPAEKLLERISKPMVKVNNHK